MKLKIYDGNNWAKPRLRRAGAIWFCSLGEHTGWGLSPEAAYKDFLLSLEYSLWEQLSNWGLFLYWLKTGFRGRK